jgi:hypothetical protein
MKLKENAVALSFLCALRHYISIVCKSRTSLPMGIVSQEQGCLFVRKNLKIIAIAIASLIQVTERTET